MFSGDINYFFCCLWQGYGVGVGGKGVEKGFELIFFCFGEFEWLQDGGVGRLFCIVQFFGDDLWYVLIVYKEDFVQFYDVVVVEVGACEDNVFQVWGLEFIYVQIVVGDVE